MKLPSRPLITPIHLAPSDHKINIPQSILTIGSCFSQSMGERLNAFKIPTLINPFGTVYNPISLASLLQGKEIKEDLFVNHSGLFFHHDFHSSFRNHSKEALSNQIVNAQKQVKAYLERCDHLLITFGTAFVFERKDDQRIVNNCHKIDQNLFSKRCLQLEEMKVAMSECISSIREKNPTLKIILTVSPVRHIKDGLVENSLSKSLLRVLCNDLSQFDDIEYFPSYEIMIDELRDYRYYKDDMLHPSTLAEEIIWDKWTNQYFDQKTLDFITKWKKIQLALTHKPFNPSSDEHIKFAHKQIESLNELSKIVEVDNEIRFFEQIIGDFNEE